MSLEYLHTMVRVEDLDVSLNFYRDVLGMVETNRMKNEGGRFTLVFLAAPHDVSRAKENKSPTIELTYNWPDEDGERETYSGGRNFGHLAYRVDDIYGYCQMLMDKGVTINRPPRDGLSIELLQRGDALEQKEPWVSMENTGSW